MERYAKQLPDGTIEIAGPIVTYGDQKFYFPSKRTLKALGYLLVVEAENVVESEGYKLVDKGMVLAPTKDKFIHIVKKLKIVDNEPAPGPDRIVSGDYWKEVGDEYVHMYKYTSTRRHHKKTMLSAEQGEVPVDDAGTEVVEDQPTEEQENI